MATAKRAAKGSATKAPAKPRAAPAPSRSADWVPAAAPTLNPGWTPAPAPASWTSVPAASPHGRPTRPVQGLRRILLPLLAAYVGLQAVSLVLSFTVPDWGTFIAPFGPSDLGMLAFSVLGMGIYIPTIVVFCMWLHRVCSNARDRHGLLDVSPGWAVGSFFVPFVQLVAPYFAVRKA